MDDKQRLNLQEMIKAYDADDNTSKIRKLKHSRRIRDDVEKFIEYILYNEIEQYVSLHNFNLFIIILDFFQRSCNFTFYSF